MLFAFRSPLMLELRRRGYRILAVAGSATAEDRARFASIDAEFVDWEISKAGLNPVSDAGPLLRLWSIVLAAKPKILFAHTIKAVIYGLLIGWLAGVPRRTVMIPGLGYAFNPPSSPRQRLVGWMARMGYRVALRRAHMVVFQNEDDRETLRRIGALGPTTQTGLVNGSGVDIGAYAPAPWPDGPPTFLMLARLLRDKGVHEFVEAARLVRTVHPDARFILAGGTDDNPAAVPREQIAEWVAEGIIEAPGHVGDPRPLFAECHAFVLPSYYREGCPRVNLEAMAMGRAVVTTDWVGCRETVIDGETGLMDPPRDAAALGQAILSLADDLAKARAMGEGGRRYCEERFELKAVMAATGDLLVGEAQ